MVLHLIYVNNPILFLLSERYLFHRHEHRLKCLKLKLFYKRSLLSLRNYKIKTTNYSNPCSILYWTWVF